MTNKCIGMGAATAGNPRESRMTPGSPARAFGLPEFRGEPFGPLRREAVNLGRLRPPMARPRSPTPHGLGHRAQAIVQGAPAGRVAVAVETGVRAKGRPKRSRLAPPASVDLPLSTLA